MPALNYQKQFAPLVQSGEKRQTIRAMRKRPFKKGDRLFHFTGMRTKACRRLRARTKDFCTVAVNITIKKNGVKFPAFVTGIDRDRIAQADGFPDFTAMRDWFKKTHGLPFKGQLVRW